jgi:predicted metal-dependent phosphoesterase TrpH
MISGIDLHTHTTASDGSYSPTELVNAAADIGLQAIAVTDHDTISGLAEAIEASEYASIEFVPGVELSVEDDGGRFHLLGYLFDPNDTALGETLAKIRVSRARRNAQMAVKMAELGLPVTMDDVVAEAGDKGEVIARPHFARALMKKGIVSSVQEAFDRYLATGKPLYLPKEVLTPADAIALIHNAGGIAVMAHPGLVPLEPSKLSDRVGSLAREAGLDGLECYYPLHSEEQTGVFLRIAGQAGILVTGGSDFHGTAKPNINLGEVHNGLPASPALLGAMRARAGQGF